MLARSRTIEVVPTIIYSSMLGITVFALVENGNRPRQRQTDYLSGLLLLLLIHILGELHIYSGFYQYAPALAGLSLPVRVLLGPALYFYAFATMSPDKNLPVKAYFIALSGPILVFVAMIPFLFGSSPAEKLALADPATRDPALWKIAVFTCAFAMLIFVLFTATYLFVTLRLHSQHRQQLMDRFSSIELRSMDWFKKVLLLWGVAWLMFAVEFTTGFLGLRWFGSGIVLPVLEAFILLLFAHLAIRQPLLKEADRSKPRDHQARAAALSAERMREIAKRLQSTMVQEALFLDEDLSLKRLSDAVSVSENHISETLSQHLKTNFFHFVNNYRIDAAKKLLLNTDKQVTTVAYEVGFKSKSTFNTAFKRSLDTTPSAFRKQPILQAS